MPHVDWLLHIIMAFQVFQKVPIFGMQKFGALTSNMRHNIATVNCGVLDSE